MNKKITIIDYGLGNLLSVKRAFEYLNFEVSITGSPIQIEKAERLIIPGVGAFPRGMEELKKRDLIDPINEFNSTERPIIAICLGMQLLMSYGEEHKETNGLNLIDGKVLKFPNSIETYKDLKVPNIGWGELDFNPKHFEYKKFEQFNEKQMYFVHSYYVEPTNELNTLAISKNENFEFCSIISFKNILGCQFHPEKSGKTGLNLINNFMLG
jgi:glutamine amidotransferase